MSDEEQSRVIGKLLRLAWPVVVSRAADLLYSIIDSIWLGRLGKEAFNAPIIAWSIIYIFYTMLISYISTFLPVLSQIHGSRDYKEFERRVSEAFALTIILTTIVFIPIVLVSYKIIILLGLPKATSIDAIKYYRITIWGIPLACIDTFFATVMRSVGDTRTPMILRASSSIANIGLDPLLIFGLVGFPRLGVVGAAIATVAAESGAGIVALVLLFKGYKGVKVKLSLAKASGWMTRKMLSIGSPVGALRVLSYLSGMVLIGILGRFGSSAIAAYGVSTRIIDVMAAYLQGISVATSIMIGHKLGAKDVRGAVIVSRRAIEFSMLTMILAAIIVLVFRVQIISAFVDDPKVILYGSRLIIISIPSAPFFAAYVIMGGVANGSGRTMPYAATGIARLWAVRILLSIILAFHTPLGLDGVWLSIFLSNIMAGITGIIWVYSCKWAKSIL